MKFSFPALTLPGSIVVASFLVAVAMIVTGALSRPAARRYSYEKLSYTTTLMGSSQFLYRIDNDSGEIQFVIWGIPQHHRNIRNQPGK